MEQENTNGYEWPYPLAWGKKRYVEADVLVLGGGIAGCWAAISAAERGQKVVIFEKGATKSSGAGGSGCDHWESAATNPCSKVTPEELTTAMIEDNGGYNNGISHYIETREGYDRLLDLEKMGAKIRDTDDEFKGAEFRDEKTKFLFAYDYENAFTLRVWGTTFKEALYKQCRKLGVKILDRVMATSLLTKDGTQSSQVVGAVGLGTRTGELIICRSKATILAMSRPARLWLFSPSLTGISEFRPPQCIGDGHAMAWRAGVEFSMMEKSIRAQWSGERCFPPYGAGNNHNTWYACSMVDATGRAIPWVDRDGKELLTISERYRPAKGQGFFIKGGGESEIPSYKYLGPETLPVQELLNRGYKLPFYSDLPGMPEYERRAIWGLMVGQEAKTNVPILKSYEEAGFDPNKHLLQSYGDGWRSGAFLPQERQLFGLPGGVFNDWRLQTNLEGLFAAGDQLFASNCHGHAAATGFYAGRHAAAWAADKPDPTIDTEQVEKEKERLFRPISNGSGIGWKELNMYIVRTMQSYCGEIKSDSLLTQGIKTLEDIKIKEAATISASNPHELMRSLEVLNILTNAEIIMQASLARKASAKHLHFHRSDFSQQDPPEWHKFVTIKKENNSVVVDSKEIDYYSDLKETYESINKNYIRDTQDE